MENGDQPAFTAMNEQEIIHGLTKREYFAAKAMQGLLSIYSVGDGINPPIVPNIENINYMTRLSVSSADALLLALTPTPKT